MNFSYNLFLENMFTFLEEVKRSLFRHNFKKNTISFTLEKKQNSFKQQKHRDKQLPSIYFNCFLKSVKQSNVKHWLSENTSTVGKISI